MNILSDKLSQLKNRLESAAFLVSKEGAAKEAHSEIIQGLVILAELESSNLKPEASYSQDETGVRETDIKERNSAENNRNEINKVSSRLKLWAKRQNQINSRILNAYLSLERSGMSTITEMDLKNELSDIEKFDSNFSQMKIIAKNNHGKVFEQYGDHIRLWAPVASEIREYESVVFGTTISAERSQAERPEETDQTMSIRDTANSWLKHHHPSESVEAIRVSKHYPEKDIWFFTFPSSYFDLSKNGYLNILLQFEKNPYEFHYLKVPFSFLRENKDKLDVRRNGDKFDLHISAKQRNWLVCERSKGVSFRELEQ